jgi:cohesin complex subunit SA-1/2
LAQCISPDAIINPSADIQSCVEDFLESLSLTPEAALAELINCILRACGCNNTIDSDQVSDYDGVVDVLEDVTDMLKKVRIYFVLSIFLKLL